MKRRAVHLILEVPRQQLPPDARLANSIFSLQSNCSSTFVLPRSNKSVCNGIQFGSARTITSSNSNSNSSSSSSNGSGSGGGGGNYKHGSSNGGGSRDASTTSICLQDLQKISKLGKGSGGEVHKVMHTRTGDIYALKEIQLTTLQEQAPQEQTMRELDILCKVHSQYVVLCRTAFYKDGIISIVLEYMDGGSLADVLKKVIKIPENYISAIAKQVLLGLFYLHKERHVIHRDIKPSNLLINLNGDVKIADFGVSAVLPNSVGTCDSFVGTCTYMSPERIVGERYGYKCDIWSLGLSVVECAIGRYPYPPPPGETGWLNFFDLLQTIRRGPAPSLPVSDSSYSSEFRSFVSACLQKNPRERASARELLKHPFIKKYEDKSVNIARLCQQSA